jgi:putative transposase
MPRSYRAVHDANYAYFITCSVVDWLPLFESPTYRQIILDSLAYLREHKSIELNAFVVMSTHLHAVFWPHGNVNISDVLRDFKRHTSRAISREATKQAHNEYLQAFAAARATFRSGRGSDYQVWQEGSHPEAIYDDDFARQKIEYIHNNPVKAGLVGKAEEWPHSSARAYLLREPTYPVTDIMDLR